MDRPGLPQSGSEMEPGAAVAEQNCDQFRQISSEGVQDRVGFRQISRNQQDCDGFFLGESGDRGNSQFRESTGRILLDAAPDSQMAQSLAAEASQSIDKQGSGARIEGDCEDEWVILNVGGLQFHATVETLCVDKDSMLAAWMLRHRRGRRVHPIDRDGRRFAHVLNYLRNGTIWLEDVPSLREVQEEASFYQLQGLHKLCEDRIADMNARLEAESKLRFQQLREAIRAELLELWPPKRDGGRDVIAFLRGRKLGDGDQAHHVFRTDDDF